MSKIKMRLIEPKLISHCCFVLEKAAQKPENIAKTLNLRILMIIILRGCDKRLPRFIDLVFSVLNK
jgi:hypothetical protein